MEQNNNINNNRTIWKGISKKENEQKNKIYVSPDNLEILMDTLFSKECRPLVINGADSRYKKKLQEIAEEYDSKKPYGITVALIKSKNVLSMERDFNLDMSVDTFSNGKEKLLFGEYTIDRLKEYFDADNIPKRIYSDAHLIE